MCTNTRMIAHRLPVQARTECSTLVLYSCNSVCEYKDDLERKYILKCGCVMGLKLFTLLSPPEYRIIPLLCESPWKVNLLVSFGEELAARRSLSSFIISLIAL